MTPPATLTQKSPDHKPRPLVDLLLSIVIPSVILMKFSGDNELGASAALIVALTFPVSWAFTSF